MADQNQGASIEAEREMMQTIRHRLDQGLDNYPLNYEQSLFLQDLLLRLEQAVRRTPAATTGEMASPPAPEHWYYCCGEAKPTDGYTLEQLYDYARAAIDRAQRQPILDEQAAVLLAKQKKIQAKDAEIADLRAQLAAKGQGEPVARMERFPEDQAASRALSPLRPAWLRCMPPEGTLLYTAAPASAQPAEQVSDAELSTIVELARVATDAHCDSLPNEPTKEYSNAYFFRAIARAAEALGAQPDQRDSAATHQAEGANQGAEGVSQ